MQRHKRILAKLLVAYLCYMAFGKFLATAPSRVILGFFSVFLLASLFKKGNLIFESAANLFFVVSIWSLSLEGTLWGAGMSAHFSLENIKILLIFKHELLMSCLFLALMFFASRFTRPAYYSRATTFAAFFLSGFLFYDSKLGSEIMRLQSRVQQTHSTMAYSDALAHLEKLGFSEAGLSQKTPIALPKAKNVVVLFLESLEARYLDAQRFPGLAPNLAAIAEESIRFENFEQHQPGYTLAGIFSGLCGLPIQVLDASGAEGNDLLASKHTHQIDCLSDILKRNRYRNLFVQSSDLKFSNLDLFFKAHSFDVAWGQEELLESLTLKQKLESGSGKTTSEASSFALNDQVYFRELANMIAEQFSQTPFLASGINFDTHAPGTTSPDCKILPQYQTDPILSSVNCADQLIREFYERMKILAASHDNNLLLVMLSDHLSMSNFREESGRKHLLLIKDFSAPRPLKPLVVQDTIYHTDLPSLILSQLDRPLSDKNSFPFSLRVSGERPMVLNAENILAMRSFFNHSDPIGKLDCSLPLRIESTPAALINGGYRTRFTHHNGLQEIDSKQVAFVYLDEQNHILDTGVMGRREFALRMSTEKPARAIVLYTGEPMYPLPKMLAFSVDSAKTIGAWCELYL